MKKLSFLVLLFVVTLGVNAQTSFLLYSFKGNVSVTESGVESKAKVGKTLNSSASLKIASGGAVTLICNEAAMFTLTKAGSYSLSQFGDSCKVSSSSVSANYVKYVWASMTKSTGTAGSNRKAYMNTVGAVSRGGKNGINNVWIDPRLDTVNYAGTLGAFPLSWKSYADAEEFEFFLYTSEDISTPFYSLFLKKLKTPITDLSAKIKPGNTYYWTSAIKGEENDDLKVLNYVTKEVYDAFLNKLKAQGPPFEAPADQAYRLAFLLEDSHYLAESYQYYTKATQLDPANALYRSTLMSFKKDYEIK